MPRRVLYDPASPAALAAATMLTDDYDVQAWTLDAAVESVGLTSDPALVAPGERTRIIGIVDATAPEPCPAGWYALVPTGASYPLVARAVENAFASLDASAQHARLERELSELNAIGIQLSAERNLDVLLETILTKAREITGSDAGSLYLVEDGPDGTRRLRFALAPNGRVEIPFPPVTLALANRRLYESISQLFDGFVKASVTAIESRDPTTFGHSFRVADLTVGLAEAVERADSAPFRGVRFSAEELRELRYAALLHDFGKVGVREHVLVKSKKLYPADLDRIRHRIELLMRELELGVARRKVEWLTRRGKDGFNLQAAKLDADLEAAMAELNEALDVVLTVNEPSVHPHDFTGALLKITARSCGCHPGRRRTVLTPEEASILAITKGSLTEAERREIQQHVVHTFQFLAQIPWTREFRRVPEIARSHHEKLDASAYPFGFRSDRIPLQSRMMTIADIYDALTATDRPYKKAVRVEEALDTLREEHRAGALDGALLEVFIEARVFERTDWR